jgi:gamma-glutamylcyclotransferase (GGCT)/AIG2-like uncharacterized protein YtfP
MKMADYLFVYGTLRKNYDLKLKNKVAGHLQYIGQGKVGASLYDIGRYPGAIKDSKGTEVIGDLFLITDPEKVLKVLDKYEGISDPGAKNTEFVRKKTSVLMRSGGQKKAWIYWYNFDPKNKVKIKHKDYLNYLKNKTI